MYTNLDSGCGPSTQVIPIITWHLKIVNLMQQDTRGTSTGSNIMYSLKVKLWFDF